MRYPTVRYVPTEHGNYLKLHSWDGTCRGVVFNDVHAADAAFADGRAEVDCAAIGRGFLPRGASLVSRAAARNIDDLITETSDPGDAVDHEALRTFVGNRAAATEYLTEERNAAARTRDPAGATHYERLVDLVTGSREPSDLEDRSPRTRAGGGITGLA